MVHFVLLRLMAKGYTSVYILVYVCAIGSITHNLARKSFDEIFAIPLLLFLIFIKHICARQDDQRCPTRTTKRFAVVALLRLRQKQNKVWEGGKKYTDPPPAFTFASYGERRFDE